MHRAAATAQPPAHVTGIAAPGAPRGTDMARGQRPGDPSRRAGTLRRGRCARHGACAGIALPLPPVAGAGGGALPPQPEVPAGRPHPAHRPGCTRSPHRCHLHPAARPHLALANLGLEKLRFLVRLAHDLRALDHRRNEGQRRCLSGGRTLRWWKRVGLGALRMRVARGGAPRARAGSATRAIGATARSTGAFIRCRTVGVPRVSLANPVPRRPDARRSPVRSGWGSATVGRCASARRCR